MKINYSNFSYVSSIPKLEDVDFAVKCSTEEWNFIIHRYHERWKSWEQCNRGHCEDIGEALFYKKVFPITIQVWFWRINGKVFACYDGCSMIVHHGLLDDFIKKNCPKVDWYRNQSDALNFHNIQRELDDCA